MTLARLGSKPSTGRLCMLSKRAMTKFLPKLASTLAMLVTAGCSGVNSSDRFDWKATESAPKNFPIEIISGTFFYHGQSGGSGLYIPSGGIIHKKGWGEMVSSQDRKSTRLNSSHVAISYAVFRLKKTNS